MDLLNRVAIIAALQVKQHQNWRVGQACFNALRAVDQECAEAVRGTFADPFYRDDRIGAFWCHVLKWSNRH